MPAERPRVRMMGRPPLAVIRIGPSGHWHGHGHAGDKARLIHGTDALAGSSRHEAPAPLTCGTSPAAIVQPGSSASASAQTRRYPFLAPVLAENEVLVAKARSNYPIKRNRGRSVSPGNSSRRPAADAKIADVVYSRNADECDHILSARLRRGDEADLTA